MFSGAFYEAGGPSPVFFFWPLFFFFGGRISRRGILDFHGRGENGFGGIKFLRNGGPGGGAPLPPKQKFREAGQRNTFPLFQKKGGPKKKKKKALGPNATRGPQKKKKKIFFFPKKKGGGAPPFFFFAFRGNKGGGPGGGQKASKKLGTKRPRRGGGGKPPPPPLPGGFRPWPQGKTKKPQKKKTFGGGGDRGGGGKTKKKKHFFFFSKKKKRSKNGGTKKLAGGAKGVFPSGEKPAGNNKNRIGKAKIGPSNKKDGGSGNVGKKNTPHPHPRGLAGAKKSGNFEKKNFPQMGSVPFFLFGGGGAFCRLGGRVQADRPDRLEKIRGEKNPKISTKFSARESGTE